MNIYYFETIRNLSDEYSMSRPFMDVSCDPHMHRQMEILYVISGQCKAQINDTSMILTDNQMAIADSFDIHAWQRIGDCNSEYLIFPYHSLASFMEAKNGRRLKTNFILDEALGLQFKMILNLIRKNAQSSNKMIVEGLTKAFLGMLLDNIELERQTTSNQRLLMNEILDYIDQNFMNDLTLEKTAAHFAYSKYYFSKLFNQLIHCHFENYINMVRTQNVLNLVQNKKRSITDAILESGFSSVPTFYRYFKQRYSCSIKQYLKKQNQTVQPFLLHYAK